MALRLIEIAPLLGPDVAVALATTLGDVTLLRRALLTALSGIATALASGCAGALAVTSGVSAALASLILPLRKG